MLMSFETTTKQRSTEGAGRGGTHDNDVVECSFWLNVCVGMCVNMPHVCTFVARSLVR